MLRKVVKSFFVFPKCFLAGRKRHRDEERPGGRENGGFPRMRLSIHRLLSINKDMAGNNFPIWIGDIFPFALSPSINSGEPCRSLS